MLKQSGRETDERETDELTRLYIWSTGQLQSKGNFVFLSFLYRLPLNVTNLTNGRGVNCNKDESIVPPVKTFQSGG